MKPAHYICAGLFVFLESILFISALSSSRAFDSARSGSECTCAAPELRRCMRCFAVLMGFKCVTHLHWNSVRLFFDGFW